MSEVMSNEAERRPKIADALRAAEGDTGASAVLVAVVQEFDKEGYKAMRQGDTPSAMRKQSSNWSRPEIAPRPPAEADSPG